MSKKCNIKCNVICNIFVMVKSLISTLLNLKKLTKSLIKCLKISFFLKEFKTHIYPSFQYKKGKKTIIKKKRPKKLNFKTLCWFFLTASFRSRGSSGSGRL